MMWMVLIESCQGISLASMEIHISGPIPNEFIADWVIMLGWLCDSVAEYKILLNWRILLFTAFGYGYSFT